MPSEPCCCRRSAQGGRGGLRGRLCAVPNGSAGPTYVSRYNAYWAEREMVENESEIGNPVFGRREISTMVFDNVFIPWDRVFLCGETKYCGSLITRFAQSHRMNCGGACKGGFVDLVIGGTILAAEYSGARRLRASG